MEIKQVNYFADGTVYFYDTEIQESLKEFKPGIYKPAYEGPQQTLYAEFITRQENHKPILTKEIKDSLKYIKSFADPKLADIIRSKGFMHKLGILTYGKPGTMKTTYMYYVGTTLIKQKKAIVVDMYNFDAAMDFIKIVRMNQDNLIVLLIDEIDVYLERFETQLKIFLDGGESVENIITIASTNKRELLSEAFFRPSRFKLQMEFKGINNIGDIEAVLKEKDTKYTQDNLRALKGCTIDEIKAFIHDEILNQGIPVKSTSVAIGFKSYDEDYESTKNIYEDDDDDEDNFNKFYELQLIK